MPSSETPDALLAPLLAARDSDASPGPRHERAVARAISWLERGDPRGQELLAALRARRDADPAAFPLPQIVGVTGSPGSGKSTLVDRLIAAARERGERVAVVAVDPSSPFSGGAILGDRIRMTRWHDDPMVFIRSMAARGHLGGLAAATLQVVALLEHAGFDRVLLETVGVGQSEIDVVRVADTTVVVLTPGAGDGVQAFKAGIMEIADVFVINKADLPGADRLVREIRAALELAHPAEGAWVPPIVQTVAAKGDGVDDLLAALSAHRAHLSGAADPEAGRRRRVGFELAASLAARLRRTLAEREEALVAAVLAGRVTPAEAVEGVLREFGAAGGAEGGAAESGDGEGDPEPARETR